MKKMLEGGGGLRDYNPYRIEFEWMKRDFKEKRG